MSRSFSFLSRRGFLGRSLAVGLGTGAVAVPAWFAVPGAFAEELARTPRLTEGPFYPPRLPLDTDNDLIIVGNSTTPAVGEITHLSGRVLSGSGEPVQGVVVEIWQCDAKGVYLAQGSQRGNDPNFQGFGKFAVNGKGEYRFRTIKPVPYPGRTPHIHFKVKKGDRELLTTQLFINGHPQNVRVFCKVAVVFLDHSNRRAQQFRQQAHRLTCPQPVRGERVPVAVRRDAL